MFKDIKNPKYEKRLRHYKKKKTKHTKNPPSPSPKKPTKKHMCLDEEGLDFQDRNPLERGFLKTGLSNMVRVMSTY